MRRPASGPLVGLAPQVREGRFAILAGPGVVHAGAVRGLRALAGMTGCGVVNTWGAKGVFAWDDPAHLGTAGLQARDFELAGLGEVDTLITTGLDPAEVTSTPWSGHATVVDLPPHQLAYAAGSWPVPQRGPERPALYTELAAVVGPMYEREGNGASAAAGLAAERPPGGLVVADAGLAGFWIARAFPTKEPGSVIVPAVAQRGFAAAAAVISACEGRAAIAVTDAIDAVTAALVELASRHGLPLDLRVWDETSVDLDPRPLLAVAGPIVAWSGG